MKMSGKYRSCITSFSNNSINVGLFWIKCSTAMLSGKELPN